MAVTRRRDAWCHRPGCHSLERPRGVPLFCPRCHRLPCTVRAATVWGLPVRGAVYRNGVSHRPDTVLIPMAPGSYNPIILMLLGCVRSLLVLFFYRRRCLVGPSIKKKKIIRRELEFDPKQISAEICTVRPVHLPPPKKKFQFFSEMVKLLAPQYTYHLDVKFIINLSLTVN
jgi:hypothetical protein